MTKRFMRIVKHEKFLDELLDFVNNQIKGFKYLQRGYTDVTFREIFQSLESIKKKIEKFEEESK